MLEYPRWYERVRRPIRKTRHSRESPVEVVRYGRSVQERSGQTRPSKTKKGYVEIAYDWDDHLYIDAPEIGPHPLTVHPTFLQHFPHDFYYDCTDELSPFGSDEGADILAMIEESVRKGYDIDFMEEAYAILSEWLEEDISTPADWMEHDDRLACDIVMIACAFASIKLTGRITDELKRSGQAALTTIVEEVEPEDRHQFELMYEQLTAFPASE